MKKIITLAIAVVGLVGNVSAQSYNMVVETTQGEKIYFDADHVKSVYLAEHPDENVGWNSLGRYLYGEDYMASAFYLNKSGDMVCSFYVEVQESKDKAGLYRLVNPYSPENYPIEASTMSYDNSKNFYIEIDASDPEGVFINLQDTGLSWGSEGRFFVYSYAAYYLDYGYDMTTVKQSGCCGTIRRNVISFPANALIFYAPEYSSTSYYVANIHGAFELDLNDTEQSSKTGKRMAKVTMDLGQLMPLTEADMNRFIDTSER